MVPNLVPNANPMIHEDRYLLKRGPVYYYWRRVPKEYRDIDPRDRIKISLKTGSLHGARTVRDEMEKADDHYWESITAGSPSHQARARYEAAIHRAKALKIVYMPAAELQMRPVTEIVERVEMIMSPTTTSHEIDAVLGGVTKPKITVTQAFEIYFDEIAADEIANKSPAQRAQWKKVKLRAQNNFVSVVGDKVIEDITREDAQKFYRWWLERITGPDQLSGSAGNRDVGNIRKLYREYFAYMDQDMPNPFRGLTFKESGRTIPAFPTDWIKSKILAPGALDGLNAQARMLVYALVETGCRPSEIANLEPQNIILEPVPYIAIKPRRGRDIKTTSSIRDVPLVGVSLQAFQCFPEGFERYRDKENTLSNTLQKFFRTNGLFPSNDHRIYSFRHSFEKRMAEAGIDFGLRCLLMGHDANRPAYGDGGSMEYRRDQLMKIALPYDDQLFAP